MISEKVKTYQRCHRKETRTKRKQLHMTLQTSRPATMVDRMADVVKDKPVPIPKTRNTPEPVDAFHMIFAKEMFELIMKKIQTEK